MRRLLLLATVGIVTFALAGGEATSVKAQDSGGWTTFPEDDYALQDSTTFVIEGETAVDTASGTSEPACVFSGQLELPPGGTVVQERMLAINLDTCQARVERGTPPEAVTNQETDRQASDWQSVQNAGEADRREELLEASGFGGGEISAASLQHSKGYLKTWWEDPATLDVNSVKNRTDWHWNGNAVKSPVYGGYNYGWVSVTGWTKESSDWNNYFTSYQTTSSSKVHYRNAYFCSNFNNTPGVTYPPTHTYYDRNKVHGRYNGTLVGEWNSKVSGGCSNYLRFKHDLERTLN